MNNPSPIPVRCRTMGMRLVFFVLLATGHLAAADTTWIKELTPPGPGSYPPIPPGTLDLQVSWKGMIDSGKLHMELAPPDEKKPGVYIVRSTASSIGLAAALFPYRNTFRAELDPSSLKPRLFQAVETDSEETVTSDTRYFRDHVEFQETTQSLANGKESRKNRVFKFSPVFDIFSTMLQVRSLKLDDGDKIALIVQPFGTPYLLRVNVRGREVHLNRKTIRLSVGMRKIDRKSLDLLPYKKMTNDATLWLSDDALRIPVELRASVFIGDIRATLTGYQKF